MTQPSWARTLLMARTVRHLRPTQVVHRARLVAQRAAICRLPTPVLNRFAPRVGAAPGWPASFSPLDAQRAEGHPNPEANARGQFSFLNDLRDLGTPPDWSAPGATRLWRFHLYYFDWAWPFLAHPDRAWARDAFDRLWRSWRAANTFARGDQWSPYVASVRAWTLCGIRPLWEGSASQPDQLTEMARHAAFIRTHLEVDVGGNHLLKNIKALFGLGVFLGDDRLVRLANRLIARQVDVQVLPDGGHFERSPSYHCQVLGDFVDIQQLLRAAGQPEVPGLGQAVGAMREWLGEMLMPDGDVPLFNDATLVGPERLDLLGPIAPPKRRLTVLSPSGFVIVRTGRGLHMVADIGPPCPPELPAHAHADCLSFELAVDGERIVVDTGTSTYEPGPRRAFERSTRAHNTVEIDGVDQTEVWGVFRAARRATPFLESVAERDETISITASHDGYERLPGRPRHRRTWHIGEGRVEIEDAVVGAGSHSVTSRLYLRGEDPVGEASSSTATVGPLTISRDGPPGTTFGCSRSDVATGFGQMEAGAVLTTDYEGPLPAVVRTIIDRRAIGSSAEPGQEDVQLSGVRR